MAISSCTSCSSGNYASQISSIRPPSALEEARRTDLNSQQAAGSSNIDAGSPPVPTVNTSGQTVGGLINIAA